MKQGKGLNSDLKQEHKKTTNRTTISPTTDIASQALNFSLRKHTYSNNIENFTTKMENFQMKNSVFFFFFFCLFVCFFFFFFSHIFAQNIDCEYSLERPQRGYSNKYSQSMF